MKRLISIVVAILALAMFSSTAQADNPGGLTCGGSVTSGSVYFQLGSTNWIFSDHHNCNLGKTYSVEIQYDDRGSLTTWHDWSTSDKTRNSGSCSAGCDSSYTETGISCVSSGAIANYRLKFWWNGGSLQSPAYDAVGVCNGNLIQAH